MLRRIKEDNPLTLEMLHQEQNIYNQFHKKKNIQGSPCLGSVQLHAYQKALANVVDQLWGLSSYLFKEIDINQVKTYKPDEKMPDSYQRYVRASRNISDFVVIELLANKKYTLAMMAAERWLRVALDCYKRNDYFSASAIIGGLASYRLNPLKLDENLQEQARDVFGYLQHVFSNHISLYVSLERKLEQGQKVIPALATLAIKLERLKSDPPGDDVDAEASKERRVKKAKRSISKTMRNMQSNLGDDHGNMDLLLDLFNLEPVDDKEKIKPHFDKAHRKSFLPLLLAELKLYKHADGVYSDWVNFFSLCRKVGFLEIKARDANVYDQWGQLALLVKNIEMPEADKLSALKEMQQKMTARNHPLKPIAKELIGALTDVLRKQRTQSFARRSVLTRHSRQVSDNTCLHFSQPARLLPDDLKKIEQGVSLRSALSEPSLRPGSKK